MKNSDFSYLLSSYNFDLPEQLIAQTPPEQRGQSRLMYLPPAQALALGGSEPGSFKHFMFCDLPALLPPNCLLVANNVQVVPARLQGRLESGGKTELLLLTPLPCLEIAREVSQNKPFQFTEGVWFGANIRALARPARRFVPGSKFWFGQDIYFSPHAQGPFGQVEGRLVWKGDLHAALVKHGEMPLPPYIRRPQTEEDAKRYQTIFANSQKAGAVAAPTAGLHFTKELKEVLIQAGHSWHELTLYVGYGTFSPLRVDDIREHKMHTEWLDIPASTVNALLEAKKKGRPIVAVGTTSARALEGTANRLVAGQDFIGATDIFIYPGYQFKMVDRLITNFHLPHSSLLLLVSALVGRQRLLAAYQEAVREGYRFFSYGDAMFI